MANRGQLHPNLETGAGSAIDASSSSSVLPVAGTASIEVNEAAASSHGSRTSRRVWKNRQGGLISTPDKQRRNEGRNVVQRVEAATVVHSVLSSVNALEARSDEAHSQSVLNRDSTASQVFGRSPSSAGLDTLGSLQLRMPHHSSSQIGSPAQEVPGIDRSHAPIQSRR